MERFDDPRMNELNRRDFLAKVGKGVGLAALTSSAVGALVEDLTAATKRIAHLSASDAAADEYFWYHIQKQFTPRSRVAETKLSSREKRCRSLNRKFFTAMLK